MYYTEWGFWYLTSHSTIFQLCNGGQFYWEKTILLQHSTSNNHEILLQHSTRNNHEILLQHSTSNNHEILLQHSIPFLGENHQLYNIRIYILLQKQEKSYVTKTLLLLSYTHPLKRNWVLEQYFMVVHINV
jgi:hypothetical protein